jgi:hypothetical protein
LTSSRWKYLPVPLACLLDVVGPVDVALVAVAGLLCRVATLLPLLLLPSLLPEGLKLSVPPSISLHRHPDAVAAVPEV